MLDQYDNLQDFDKVYVAKVFDFTRVPDHVLELPIVVYGGSGFFFDEAPPLPPEIEHMTPDYTLYDPLLDRVKSTDDYTDASIGYCTRGCIRQCPFCINRNSTKVVAHSPLWEFLDPQRKRIILLDDNIFAYKNCLDIFHRLQETNKPFTFKQGVDIRLLTEEKARVLIQSKYDGDYIFAFDNYKDKDIIEKKLKLWSRYWKENKTRFYLLTGFNPDNEQRDLFELFERIRILMSYGYKSYVIRHRNYLKSRWKSIYKYVACWCNQPDFFSKTSFREFSQHPRNPRDLISIISKLEKEYPQLSRYFDMKFE
jgi:hypothetical protein